MTATLATETGQLQLNAMEPVIALNILQSIELLSGAVAALDRKCIQGIRPMSLSCSGHLMRSMALAAALVPVIGYDRAADLAKRALDLGKTLDEVIEQSGCLPDGLLRQVGATVLSRLTDAHGVVRG